jgi:transcriptional regulator with XRE-family HTH domain
MMLSMDGGILIREARLRAGLSQQALAARLGTHQSVVARWETGASEPTLATVRRAMRAAGFDLSVAVTPADDDHDRLIGDALRRSPKERIDELLARLDLEERLHEAVLVR